MFHYKKRLVFLTVIIAFAGNLSAQNTIISPSSNSPYSRFGLGDFSNQNFAAAGGMGGLSAAFYDPFHLNVQNPASLVNLQATAFEVGLYAKYSSLEEGDKKSDLWSGNLNYIGLGFPLINPISRVLDRNKSPWSYGMSFALQPLTRVGYDIRAQVQRDDELELTTNIYKGTGGVYKLSWGNGVKYNNFSAGVTLGYVFGKITNSRRVQFDSLQVAYNTEFLDETSLSGFAWNVGTQYTLEFGKINKTQSARQRFIFGLYGNSAQNFNTNSSKFYQRNATFAPIDTLLNVQGVREKGTLPAEVTAGVTYEQPNKLKIGVEYGVANWGEYTNAAKPENLVDANRLAVGLEYIPEFNSYNNYFDRVRYRIGFSQTNDPRRINGEQLKASVISLGFGFPIVLPRQQVSFVNFALEGGRFGSPNVVRENFVRFTLGFTLNDQTWFFKRKLG